MVTATATRRKVVEIASAAALGGFLFGYDTAVINGAVKAIQSTFQLSNLVLGFVVSSALLGSAVGAWFAGPLADRYGRIKVMVLAATVFFISALGSGLSFTAWELTIWRIFGGLAVGAASVIAPAYIAEVAPPDIRGRLGSLQQLAIVTGIFASQIVNYLLLTSAGGQALADVPWGGQAWRWMFAVAAMPAALYGILSLRIPESPRYLVKIGNPPRARDVLTRYVGGDVELQLSEIRRSLADAIDRVRLRDLRGSRLGLLPIVWVGILLSVFQQFVGINVIFYYSTTLWQAVGFSENNSFITSVITSITNVLTTFIAIALVDRVGRKPLLLAGAAGMAVTLSTMAICFSTATGTGSNVKLAGFAGPVALIAANLYVVSFGASWGPVVWVLLGEIFNNKIRATALAVAAAAQWVANWIISTTFPSLAGISLVLAYGLYAGFAVLAFIFVSKAVRETRGRTLESM
jgi:SP family sugar:H+ symporter-like MFS transporter